MDCTQEHFAQKATLGMMDLSGRLYDDIIGSFVQSVPTIIEAASGETNSKETLQRKQEGLDGNISHEQNHISGERKRHKILQSAPSLEYQCLMNLMNGNIESLEGVPNYMKDIIMEHMSRVGRINDHNLELYLDETTTEIHLTNCTFISEKLMGKALAKCSINLLKVIKVDFGGRCMSDRILKTAIATMPNGLASLTKLSCRGAYRLSDEGVIALASSAINLKSINLSQCRLLTYHGIVNLVEKLDLVALYLDYSRNVDVMKILPALLKLKHLENLSVSGLDSVSDDFVGNLVFACGSSLKKLIFTDCYKLSNNSMKAIGDNCTHLYTLDVQRLEQLSDTALEYLAGCRSMKILWLQSNPFSDEAIAMFLGSSGQSLIELSLDSVNKCAKQTADSISIRCQNLRMLNISFCHKITEEKIELILKSCPNIEVLSAYGCRQITDKLFCMNEHVKIIGVKDGKILQRDDIMREFY